MDQFSTPQKPLGRSVLKEINANEFVKKSSSTVQGSVKSPLALDSDISSIETDNTGLSGFDSTIETSYQNADTTLSDLLSGLGGLQLNTPHRLPKPNQHDANNSISSDEEMFQECESGYDLDATEVISEPSLIPSHSSNIDNNVFDKTINFSSIASNSTAGVAIPTQQSSKNETLFKSIVANETFESIVEQSSEISNKNPENFTDLMNQAESVSKVINDENLKKSSEIMVNAVEQPVNIEIIVTQDQQSLEEKSNPVQLDLNEQVQLKTESVDMQINPEVEQIVEIISDEEQIGELQPEIEINVTQEIQTEPIKTAEPETQTDEIIELNSTINLNETANLSSKSTEIESLNDITIEVLPSIEESESSTNTTIALETPEFGTEAVENVINISEEVVNEIVELSEDETFPNATTEVSNQSFDVASIEKPSTQNESQNEVNQINELNEIKPLDTVVETPFSSIPSVNEAYEAMDVDMDVDMDEPVELQQKATELATNNLSITQPHFNQTIEMTELDQTDESPVLNLNVTVDAPAKIVEKTPTEMFTSFDKQSEKVKINNPAVLNVTQDFIDEPKKLVALNQTVDLSNLKTNITSPIPQNNVNETFAKCDSPSVFDQTQNISKDFLSSTRRQSDINNKTIDSSSKINLNETVVVDTKLPTINTSYIVSSKITEIQPESNGLIKTTNQTKIQDQFKLPAAPSTTSNPFELKSKTQDFEVPDDEFESPGLILNPNDFDFLLSRGCNNGQVNPRDSILERFDPISGRKSVIPSSVVINRPDVATVSQPCSTIFEIDSVNETSEVCASETLISLKQSPIIKSSASSINERGDNESIVKLESSDKTENSIGVDGDHSLASSTTETYDTASTGEPIKTDVTMSVGLIHDLKMDNMKSLEQVKVEPNLKMNDELKVKQEMVGDVERKLKEVEAREEALLRRITEKEKALNKMSSVVENYEKTMVELYSEREQITQNYEKQLMQIKSERDANFHHLTSLENTFSDLHIKYEKCKQTTVEMKEKEAQLKEKLEFSQQQMKLQEQRYDKLKNHALSQLEGANAKLEALNKAHTNEMKKLTAQLKKEEISRQSMMEQLAQKTKENEELVKICDELINTGADGS